MNMFSEYFLQSDNIKTSQEYENCNHMMRSSCLKDYGIIQGWLNGE